MRLVKNCYYNQFKSPKTGLSPSTATVFGGTGIPLDPLSSGSIGCGGMPSKNDMRMVSCGIVDSACASFSAW
jgi:hypothetical protein